MEDVANIPRGLPIPVLPPLSTILGLLIPLQYAVLVGVAISVLLFVIQQSNQVNVKQLVMTESGWPIEQEPPAELRSNEVVMLMP